MGKGRPKGSKNKIAREHKCKSCNVDLFVGKNWYASMAKKNSNYQCIECKKSYITKHMKDSGYSKQHYHDNKEDKKAHMMKTYLSEGTGVYQVMLNSICLYVGEGQLKARKDRHLKFDSVNSLVVKYCNKHNINRKLLSFNVLEYEDDKTRMEQLEDWYITFLTPVINPKPPLGIYL